jgi:hypothetical protein
MPEDTEHSKKGRRSQSPTQVPNLTNSPTLEESNPQAQDNIPTTKTPAETLLTQTKDVAQKLVQQEMGPQVSNIITGLSYRVVTVEEKDRKHIGVKLTYGEPPNVPNIVVLVPPEPTSFLHMPNSQKIQEWLRKIGRDPAPPAQNVSTTDMGATTAYPIVINNGI